MKNRSFASDNFSGVLPEVMKALEEVNQGHAHSYSEDEVTEKAIKEFRRVFDNNCEVFWVYNGTGANVLSISAFVHSYNAIICAETSHISVDECGAVQRQTGCVLRTLPTFDGKLTPGLIQNHLSGFGEQHHSQPRVVSISECTELGTAYSPQEIKEICDFAHAHGLYVHMDGARLANAVACFGCEPADLTSRAGVDVVSVGGTKNGMMFGEAVIFFNTEFCADFKYIRKQTMQLHSKSRYIAAQFLAVLKDDLWLRSATHANEMAQRLAAEARTIPGVTVTQEVDGNEVFAIIPRNALKPLLDEFFFYVWDENATEVRWVCSFDTTENDVIELINKLRNEVVGR